MHKIGLRNYFWITLIGHFSVAYEIYIKPHLNCCSSRCHFISVGVTEIRPMCGERLKHEENESVFKDERRDFKATKFCTWNVTERSTMHKKNHCLVEIANIEQGFFFLITGDHQIYPLISDHNLNILGAWAVISSSEIIKYR